MSPAPFLLTFVALAVVSVRAAEPSSPKPAPKLKGSAFGEPPQEILLWENGNIPGFIEGAHKAWPGVGENGVQLIDHIGIPVHPQRVCIGVATEGKV